jgi:hypothetical protein
MTGLKYHTFGCGRLIVSSFGVFLLTFSVYGKGHRFIGMSHDRKGGGVVGQNGIQIGIGTQTVNSAGIPETSYSQVQFVTPVTGSNVSSAMIRFSFTPGHGNTNTVKIDDVMLECVPLTMGDTRI